MSDYMAILIFVSTVSFGLGWWFANKLLSDEKKELINCCDEALEKLEPILESINENEKTDDTAEIEK